MKTLLSIIVILASIQSAFGCRTLHITDEERFERAESVYRGVVSGIRIPALEAEPPSMEEGEIRRFSVGRTDYELRVMVGQTLKGEPKDLLIFDVYWCGGGYAELGEDVTIFRSPGSPWYVRSHAHR